MLNFIVGKTGAVFLDVAMGAMTLKRESTQELKMSTCI